MGVKVFAPASVANLAVGYDSLGLCLDGPGDEIIADLTEVPGVTIAGVYGADGKLPTDPAKNTAGRAAQALLEAHGDPTVGVSLRIYKRMPFGSGLGSSSASAVAGAMATNEILRRPFTKRELLPFAAAGEQVADGAWHVDNVAPSLLGGIVLVRDNATLDVHRLLMPNGLRVCVVHPHIQILTREARQILAPTVPLADVVRQQSNLGGLIVGLYRGDLDLIRRSLVDHVIEPQRARLIPGFAEVKAGALEAGALGCSISGAGPSVFALCQNELTAEEAGQAMARAFAGVGVECDVYQSGINVEGARLC